MRGLVLSFLLFSFGGFACASGIATTILPTKFFVDKIAGGEFEASAMVGVGDNPHIYEPKPKQMKFLENSEIYFSVGVEFDEIWTKKFASMYPNLKIIDTSKGVEKREFSHEFDDDSHAMHAEDEFSHAKHDHAGLDPHIWLEPAAVKIQAKNILDALCEVYPKNCDKFSENFAKFSAELDALDEFASKKFENLKNRNFIVYHPNFRYFAAKYDLNEIDVEIDGKEPKPAQIAALLKRIKSENIRLMVIAPQFSKQTAQILASESGIRIVEIDPLSENWEAQMRNLIEEIAKNDE